MNHASYNIFICLILFSVPNQSQSSVRQRTPGKVGFDILKNIIQYDYKGTVYPINPSADEILGKKSYPSLADVPDSVDLAVVVVPSKNVLEVIEQCGKKKILQLSLLQGSRKAGLKVQGSSMSWHTGQKRQVSGLSVRIALA